MRAPTLIKRKRQQGFTLLEILIALLIVSFGLLGIAGLQLVTLKTNVSSQHRSLASHYAQNIAERMRANASAAEIGAMRTPFTAYNAPATGTTHSGLNTFDASCKSVGCLPEFQAKNDLAEWQQAIAQAFPRGIGIVCIDSGSNPGPNGLGGEPTYDGTMFTPNCDGLGETFTVKIAWLDNRTTENTGAADTRAYHYFNTPISVVGF
jgi:type IV pilus assembly protein PilV